MLDSVWTLRRILACLFLCDEVRHISQNGITFIVLIENHNERDSRRDYWCFNESAHGGTVDVRSCVDYLASTQEMLWKQSFPRQSGYKSSLL